MKTKNKFTWKFWLILFTVIAGIILFIIFSINEGSNSDTLQTTKALVCEDIQVPYEVQEEYTEKEPYQEIEYYNYPLRLEDVSAVNKELIELGGRGYYQQAKIEIKNLDTQSGWVNVVVNWKTLNKQSTDTVRHYINPDQIVEFISEFDVDRGEDNTYTFNYISDPIQKSRIVTKYRDVTKTRTITKYKTEKKCN
ncbi:MAG: hypothetical protein AABX65_00550 [Nanoarchaeota archaeon]